MATKTKLRSVDEYLRMLKLAGRSPKTTDHYRKVFESYAKVIGVPITEIHHHLSADNLMKYTDAPFTDKNGNLKKRSEGSLKTNLTILYRYMSTCGVEFDEMETKVAKAKRSYDGDDKPLELATLQKMMDLTDVHGRAIISFLISTGCRAGETAQVLLSDVNGDCVNIRNEIAKGGHGGKVYLTSECREYLNIWLKERDEYILKTDNQMKGLVARSNAHQKRPDNDQRLFAVSYNSMNRKFARLYKLVDGSRGKYHAQISLHSCRKYFRTNAVKTMPLDLVEALMRHTGYLASSYVRMSEEDKRKLFHAGEHALYITRPDDRRYAGKVSRLEKENLELKQQFEEMRRDLERLNRIDQMTREKIESVAGKGAVIVEATK